MKKNFLNAYNGSNVLITGHTGFKGSWLTIWLKYLGANVTGISLDPYTNPSHFSASNIRDEINDLRADIRNKDELKRILLDVKPDFVFHLAAQALVSNAYEFPIDTWQTNLIGTLNLIDALRYIDKKCAAVFVTSDKCYQNLEWVWGYRENDILGGVDPYSASKAATEIAIRSHIKSFFSSSDNSIRIGSARAGNVIGGGDWSQNRIVPDCIRAWTNEEVVLLRNPSSTRPWQHVLEPLSGYLVQAIALSERSELHGESFNFGPSNDNNNSVLDLVNEISIHWDKVKWEIATNKNNVYESGLLKLNCDKALHELNWQSVLDFESTVSMTIDWYKSYYKDPKITATLSKNQIIGYTEKANIKGLSWAQ